MTKDKAVEYFKLSPELIRLVASLYFRFPLSSQNSEDLMRIRGIGVSHEKR